MDRKPGGPSVGPSLVAASLEATLALLPSGEAHPAGESIRRPGTFVLQVENRTASEALRPPSIEELPPITMGGGNADAGDLRPMSTLGEGGMGRVVLATQRSLRRRVAVKTLQEHTGARDELVLEGVVTGMLEHPNIPPVHALNRDAEGRPVLVMKHIEGVTWADVLRDEAHPLRQTSPLFSSDQFAGHVEILSQICNALDLAHARGVIHRDIKPENVMLGHYGEVYLIDWGIAFYEAWNDGVESSPVVGTPAFMAPEMVTGSRPDARTDVYLLGATLHSVLTGRPPHPARDLREALLHALESPSPTFGPEVPGDLADLCRLAMSREPAERPASAREFRSALRSHLSHRASIRLCEGARTRFRELSALLGDPAHDVAEAARLQHECRFGYGQALREWPDNPEASEGVRGVCRTLALHEVAQDNPRGARTWLADMPGGDPGLEATISELEDRHRARAEEERARREQEREIDLANAARERNIVAISGVAATAAVVLWRVFQPTGGVPLSTRHEGLLSVWITVMAVVTVPLAVFWRRLSKHTVNRQMIQLVLVAGVAVALNRVSGIVFLPGAASTLVGDLAIVGSLGIMVPRSSTKAFAWGGLICLMGAALIVIVPTYPGPFYNAVSIVSASTVLLLLRRDRASRGGKSGTPSSAPAARERSA